MIRSRKRNLPLRLDVIVGNWVREVGADGRFVAASRVGVLCEALDANRRGLLPLDPATISRATNLVDRLTGSMLRKIADPLADEAADSLISRLFEEWA